LPRHGLKFVADERGVPEVVLDFGWFTTGQAEDPGTNATDFATTLVVADNDTGYPYAVSCPEKTVTPYLVHVICKFLTLMRHRKLRLKTDNEPAVLALAQAVAKARLPDETLFDQTPLYSSASNGRAERTIQTVRRQAVCIRLDLERRYGMTIDSNHPVWPWLVRHAAWTQARFHVKSNGRTCFQELHDSHYKSELVPFGETVLFMMQRDIAKVTGRPRKADAVMHRGIWLGRTDEADDCLIGTAQGITRARTVRRLEAGKNHDKDLFSKLAGTPWNPKPSDAPPVVKEKRVAPPVLEMPIGEPAGPPACAAPEEPAHFNLAEDDDDDEGPPPGVGEDEADFDHLWNPGDPLYQQSPTGGNGNGGTGNGGSGDGEVLSPTDTVDMEYDRPPDTNTRATKMPRRDLSDSPTAQNRNPALTPMSTFPAAFFQHGSPTAAGAAGPSDGSPSAHMAQVTMDEVEDPTDYDLKDESVTSLSPEALASMRMEGRAKELQKMTEFGVFEVVPHAQTTGKQFISTRWEENLKVDDSGTLVLRERFVCREFKSEDPWRTDLFAPTTSPTTSRLIDLVAIKRGWITMKADVSVAFYHAPEEEEVYVMPPSDWLELQPDPSVRWRLRKQLAGRRKAPQKWLDFASSVLDRHDWQRCVAIPYLFRHPATSSVMEVHMDDFHATGPPEFLPELFEDLKSEFLLKTEGPFGVGDTYTHLKRVRTRTSEGVLIRAGEQHIDNMQTVMELTNCKPKLTPMQPGFSAAGEYDEEADPALEQERATLFRRTVGISLHISHDRPESQFTICLLSSYMSKPTESAWQALKHFVRFLSGTKFYGVFLPAEGGIYSIDCLSDADWAGCKNTRKSVSCGHIKVGNCLATSFTRRQQIIALASGESEYYAGVSVAAEGIYIREAISFLLPDLNGQAQLGIRLFMDSSAARGICARLGVGKVRHLACRVLWLQDKTKSGEIKVKACPGAHLSADLGTKALARVRLMYLMNMINMREFRDGQVAPLDVPAAQSEVSNVNGPVPAVASQAQVAGMLATIILGLCQRAGAADTECHELQTTAPAGAVVVYDDGSGEPFFSSCGLSLHGLYIFTAVVFMIGMFVGWSLHKCLCKPAPSTKAIHVDAEVDASLHRRWDDDSYLPHSSASSSTSAATPCQPTGSRTVLLTKNQRVQGPCTYRRDYMQPRFQPLPSWAWGAQEETS
jgi:hypothetical protein